MDPREVSSPSNKITPGSVEVLVGKSEDAYFSIAKLEWDGEPRVGIRWNNSGAKQKGYPVGAYGHPQWFILPKEIALAYAKEYDKQNNGIKIYEIIQATSAEPLK